MVQKLGRKAMEAFSDSKLVVGQVMGELEKLEMLECKSISVESNACSQTLNPLT